MSTHAYAGITIAEGEPPVRVIQWDRDEWRSERRRPALPPPAPASAETCFCACCRGNGRIYEEARDGEGLVPQTCATCEGTGVVPLA